MKKTEIIKLRVDSATFGALKTLCDKTDSTVSEVVRRFLVRELASSDESGGDLGPAPSGETWAALVNKEDDRATCARLLADIMLGSRTLSGAFSRDENWRNQKRRVSDMLERIFTLLEGHSAPGKVYEKAGTGKRTCAPTPMMEMA